MRLVPVDFGTPQLAAGDADRGDALEFTPATPTVLSAKPRELTNRPPAAIVSMSVIGPTISSGLIASSESANVVLSGGLCPSASTRRYVGSSWPIWLRYSDSINLPALKYTELARAMKLPFEHDCTFGVDNPREVKRFAVSHEVVMQQQ